MFATRSGLYQGLQGACHHVQLFEIHKDLHLWLRRTFAELALNSEDRIK